MRAHGHGGARVKWCEDMNTQGNKGMRVQKHKGTWTQESESAWA